MSLSMRSITGRIKRTAVKRARKTIGFFRSLLGLSYRSMLEEEDVCELLRGKTIALVGNAASLAATTSGAAVDAHDVVIRFNAAPLPSAASHGARTAIIATSVIIDPALMQARGAKQVFFMSPRPRYLPRWLWTRPDFFLFPVASHAALVKALGARPTTGMMVIDLLRRSPCADVDLYGFDFFDSGSLSDSRPRKSSPHDFAAERKLVLDLLQDDRRFRLNNPASAGN